MHSGISRAERTLCAVLTAWALGLVPAPASAQAAGCGPFANAFGQVTQGAAALASVFYGPWFKWGCLIAVAVCGLALLLDEGTLPRIVQWILRVVAVIALVAAAATWITAPVSGSGC